MADDKNRAIYYAKYISHHLAVKASRVNACPQMTLIGRFEPYLRKALISGEKENAFNEPYRRHPDGPD
ncbi:MAG: hypothetical protein ACMZ66_01900 [Thalassospira sp.]|uniref:hypothetical protein n=1 Tax=Thalassospira sp. TaxID=1912094 RepID=UPI003A83902E